MTWFAFFFSGDSVSSGSLLLGHLICQSSEAASADRRKEKWIFYETYVLYSPSPFLCSTVVYATSELSPQRRDAGETWTLAWSCQDIIEYTPWPVAFLSISPKILFDLQTAAPKPTLLWCSLQAALFNFMSSQRPWGWSLYAEVIREAAV